MIETLLAFVSAPLWMALVGKKAPRKESPRRLAGKRAASRTRSKAAVKRAPAPSSRKSVPPPPVEAPEPHVEEEAPVPKPPPPLTAPGLFYPRSNEAAESLTPGFGWFYVGGATHYELVWSADAHFHKAHILLTNQTAAMLPPEQALEPGKTYLWRVRAGNEGGWGPWSATQAFKTPEA